MKDNKIKTKEDKNEKAKTENSAYKEVKRKITSDCGFEICYNFNSFYFFFNSSDLLSLSYFDFFLSLRDSQFSVVVAVL